jgi:hypothetical protein
VISSKKNIKICRGFEKVEEVSWERKEEHAGLSWEEFLF